MSKNLAIIFADNDEGAPFRYRCPNIVEALKTSEKWQAKYFLDKDYEEAKKTIPEASLIIIERQTGKNGTADKIIAEAKKYHKKIAYDIDDLVYSPKHSLLMTRATGSRNPFYWIAYSYLNGRLAKKSDAIITTTNFLKNKINNDLHKPTFIIPNFLNFAQLTASEKPQKSTTFTLGYFSGTRTHNCDFALIENQIIHFLNLHRDAQLLIVGDLNLSQKFDFIENQIIRKPKVDYVKLQEYYALVSVNLAPLIVNDFTNCKSELKFFEPAIVETVTIASPTDTMKSAIKDGETGYICQNNEWYDKLEYLYNHRQETTKIAQNAKKYCLKNYYGEKIKTTIENVYDSLIK